jgi:hypothetical protein
MSAKSSHSIKAFDGIQLTSNDGAFMAHEQREVRHSRTGSSLTASDSSPTQSLSQSLAQSPSPSVGRAGSPSPSAGSANSSIMHSGGGSRALKLISASSSIGFDRVGSVGGLHPGGAPTASSAVAPATPAAPKSPAYQRNALADSKDEFSLPPLTSAQKARVSHQTQRGCREKTREVFDLIGTEDDPGCCCNSCCTTVTVYSFVSGLATLAGVVIEILKNTKFTDSAGNRVWYPSPYPSPLTLHLMSIMLGVVFGVEVLVRFLVARAYFSDSDDHGSSSGLRRSVKDLPFFRNPFNWFDILSIPPFDTGFFRILRVFRLSSRWDSSVIVYETMYKSGRPIAVSMLYLLSILTLVASIFYFFESCYYRMCEMPDLFSMTYFLVITITTVGYGDQVPVTWYGKIIAIIVMLAGSFFLAMPLSIVGTEFERAFDENEKLREKQDKTGRLQRRRELRNMHVTVQQRRIRAMQLGYKMADLIEVAKDYRLRQQHKLGINAQLHVTPSEYLINMDRDLVKTAQQLIRDILILFKVNPEEFRILAEEVTQVREALLRVSQDSMQDNTFQWGGGDGSSDDGSGSDNKRSSIIFFQGAGLVEDDATTAAAAAARPADEMTRWGKDLATIPKRPAGLVPPSGTGRKAVEEEDNAVEEEDDAAAEEAHGESKTMRARQVKHEAQRAAAAGLPNSATAKLPSIDIEEAALVMSSVEESVFVVHSADDLNLAVGSEKACASALPRGPSSPTSTSPRKRKSKRRKRRMSAEDVIGNILTHHNRQSLKAIQHHPKNSLTGSFSHHLRPSSDFEKRVLFRNPTLAANMLKFEIEAAKQDENYDSNRASQRIMHNKVSTKRGTMDSVNSRNTSIISIALADTLLGTMAAASPMQRAIRYAEESKDCRSRLWLMVEVPWYSRLSKVVRGGRLVFTLLSLILLYCETMPVFNKYGPETRLCKQVVNYHCGKVPETPEGRDTNPLCFPNATANYSGCRGIVTPSEFIECGFPTNGATSASSGVDFSCALHNETNTNNNLVIRYTDPAPWAFGIERNVRICERVQCTENSSQDNSRAFAVSEVIVVLIFVIELVVRIVASTRPMPFEDEEEEAKRRHLHWTWARFFRRVCGCCCCCLACDCNIRGCQEDDHESEYLAWFAQNFNEENAGAGGGGGGGGRDIAGRSNSRMRDKHKADSVVYGLHEWFSLVNNQIDVLSTVCAVGEVIWVPLSFTFNDGFKYEVWGLSTSFDPAVFRVVRVLVSIRFISMERFFDDTVAIRHTFATTAIKLVAPLFFLLVFVLIVSALFIWIEVDVSADMYECDDWSAVLGVPMTSDQFYASCKRCHLQTLDLSDPFMGNKKRYDGTCRRVVNQATDKPFMWTEPLVQTFDESIWFVFVTVTTTGYGRFVPGTMLGKVVMILTSLAGVLYLAMPLTVVSAKFFDIFAKMRENNRYILLHKERKRLRMEAKKRDELIAQRTSHEASRLTFKMVVTLKMLARRVRTRSQYRAPLTMSQQRIVADYEEQVYQVRCTTALEQQCRWILVASASVVLGEKAGSVCGLLLWFSDI